MAAAGGGVSVASSGWQPPKATITNALNNTNQVDLIL
jgi:hypothetical protein